MFNPPGVALFIFCLTVVILVAVFAPALIWTAVCIWGGVVLFQIAVSL